MTESQEPRPPVQGRAGRGSKDASIRLTAFNGAGSASSAFRNDPQALLGLSTGPSPMSITCTGLGTLRRTSGSDQHIYAGNNISSDYHSSQDLELTEPQDCSEETSVYPVPQSTNGNVADPLQRLASAEPEQLPWSGIHLNGVPPSQPTREPAQNSSKDPRMGQQRSLVGSHANETDEGYHTYSQPDLHSVYSAASSQMYYTRPGPSSMPRSMPSIQGQPGPTNYNGDPVYRSLDYQFTQPLDQQSSSQVPQNLVQQQEPFHCAQSECSYTCKTQSDLKKHVARHEKPHVCNQANCARAEKGFATINDLERHQKTVHNMEPAHGLSRMYKCFAPNCKQHAKEWPRQDNFKQHLMRMHKGESVVALLQRSIDWYDTEKRARQAASETESPESGQQPASSNQPYRGSSDNQQSQSYLSPTWRPSSNTTQRQQTNIANRTRHSSFSGQPHASPGNALGSNGNPLLHTTFTTNPLQFSYQSLFDNSHHIQPRRFPSAFTVPNPEVPALSDLPERVFPSCSPSFTTPQNDLAQIASNFPSEQHSDLPSSDHELHSPSGPANETPQCSRRFPFSIDDVHALMNNNAGGQKNKNAAMLELIKAGWEKINESKRPSTAAKTTSSSPSIITSTATTHPDSTDTCVPFRCPETRCNKTFSRPCDLKKHMKRHDRPYGCTFSKCYEKFGSKYDWKRHETYQHFQQECWKCDLCLTNSAARNGKSLATTTSQLFYKRKLYEDHLRHVHSSSPEMILDLVWKQRIGRNCQSRFWCGFCEKIVVLEKKGLEGANERFNHIDDHFKKNRQINEWVEMEGSMAKGDQQGIGREEDEESVEDVLGEDGINSGPNGRGQDTEDDGDDNDNHSAAEPERVASRTGQKRHRSSDFDISPSSDQRSARRQRTINPDPTRKSGSRTRSRAEYMVICHQCENGPVVLQHSERCISCQHDFCGSCTYSCRPKPDE